MTVHLADSTWLHMFVMEYRLMSINLSIVKILPKVKSKLVKETNTDLLGGFAYLESILIVKVLWTFQVSTKRFCCYENSLFASADCDDLVVLHTPS